MRGAIRLGLVILFLSGCAGAPAGRALTADHRAAIVDSVQAMLHDWSAAFGARDFGRATRYYSRDSAFRWFENAEITYPTAQAITDSIMAMAPRLKEISLTLVDPVITPLAPGVAAVSAEFTQKITDSTGVTGFAGVMTATVIHADSGWRFLMGHSTLVTPQPATPAH